MNGFWSPDVMDDDLSKAAPFKKDTIVFECLTRGDVSSCQATNDTRSPAFAFTCAEGYHGVLCAACSPGYFFQEKQCLRCDDTAVPPSVVAGLVLLVVGAVGLVAYKLFARRHAKTILSNLHGIRRRLRKRRRNRPPIKLLQVARARRTTARATQAV